MSANLPLQEQIASILLKVERSLVAAETQCKDKNYDFASSRAYYAVFYAIEAVLLTQKMVFSSHSAVISAFNQHFIKPGTFPKEYSTLIMRLFKERQIGDYDFVRTITEAQATEDLKDARKIIDSVKEYLKKN